MIIGSNELKNICQKSLKQTTVNRFNLINSLFASLQKNSIVTISHDTTQQDCTLTAIELIAHWFANSPKSNLFLLDFYNAQTDQQTFFDELEQLDIAKDSEEPNVLFVVGTELVKETRLVIKKLINISKKKNLKIYFFFNEIGFFYQDLYKRYDIPHFYLSAPKYSDYLFANDIKDDINIQTFGSYLESQINLISENHESFAQALANKVLTIFRHDVYDLHKKKYDIHTCLDLLRYIAYAEVPLFDLKKLAYGLNISSEDCLSIIKIFETAKIIKTLSVVNRDMRKTLPDSVYIVFADPIYYFAFTDAITDVNSSLRFWTSTLINTYQRFDKLSIVEDLYVSLNDQVGIISNDKKTFLQMGLNQETTGPLLNYLKYANEDLRAYYLQFEHLLNFVVNWQLKNIKKCQIN